MLTRHRGFYITCGGDALECIFQRHCSNSGPVSASMIERLLQEILTHKRAYPIMHNDEINSFCNPLQSQPDGLLTRYPPSDDPTHFPKSVTLYYRTLTQGTLLCCYHNPDVIYSSALLKNLQRAC